LRDGRAGGANPRRIDPCAPTSPPAARFPDHELPDPESVPRTLSEIQGDDPLILTLARGHCRPKEHQQHLELAAFYPKIAVAHTQIATIATDDDSAGVPRTEEA
jgi:hypothetical protein